MYLCKTTYKTTSVFIHFILFTLKVLSTLNLPLGRLQDWKKLQVLTTLLSLNKILPSSGLTDSYVFYFLLHIRNHTDMLPVDNKNVLH